MIIEVLTCPKCGVATESHIQEDPMFEEFRVREGGDAEVLAFTRKYDGAKLEALEVGLGEARSDENTWIDSNATLENNVMVHLGLTLFFPFTFDYRYPK